MKKTSVRSVEQVVDDPLWPPQGLSPDPTASFRYRAIANVLLRIPEDAYIKLIEKSDEFSWFIPDEQLGGMVMPFRCTMPRRRTRVAMAKVLYLSPGLERRSFDVAVASIAHELAHIFLNHDVITSDYDKQEREAWETVKAWGFENEGRAMRGIINGLIPDCGLRLRKRLRRGSRIAHDWAAVFPGRGKGTFERLRALRLGPRGCLDHLFMPLTI